MIKKLLKSMPGIRGIESSRLQLKENLEAWQKNQQYPPGHYYSPIPDIEDIKNSFHLANLHKPDDVKGINLNWQEQISLFKSLSSFYSELPFPINKETNGQYRYFFENQVFTYGDAILLYSLLRYLRPQRLIEVGSGYSSCLTLDVNDLFLDNSLNTTFIDPYPERLENNLRKGEQEKTKIIRRKVQDTSIDLYQELQDGDILFIDSSHVSKACSDVNFLMFEVLPTLNPGVWVHFHDVFYPFEYPKTWIVSGRSWNEAYLVRSFLLYNSEFEIRLWGDALCTEYRDVVESHMPMCLKNPGASLWLQKCKSK